MRHRSLTAALLGATLAGAMPLVHAAGVTPDFMNGGVGKDDAARMHAQAKHYPLQIEFSERHDNEFVADAKVKIADARGHTVFERSGMGPILLVRLPSGRYRVTASADGHAEARTVRVPGHGTKTVYFHWNDAHERSTS